MGLATAQLLASRGASISLADLKQDALLAAVSTLQQSDGQVHLSYVVDVRSTEAIDDWISITVSKYRRLDGAVNMAGVIVPTAPTENVTDMNWGFVMDVNATGVFKCLRAEIRAMKKLGMNGSIVSLFLGLIEFLEKGQDRQNRVLH